MFTLVAYETTASLAVLSPIVPVPDPTVAVIGNDIRVPTALPNIVGAFASITGGAGTIRAEIVTPSLRALFPFDVSPIGTTAAQASSFTQTPFWYDPVGIVGLEPMDFLIQNGAAVLNRGYVWLADGALKPTTGKMYTIRATATATLVTDTWVNSGALTFANTLPAGHYQLVGIRSISANQGAARVFFVGYPWRPGVIAVTSESSSEYFFYRYGNMGVFGEFDNTVPPTVDFLGTTDVAEILYLDLIKTS
jgi:hypothetical protein